MNKTNKYHKFDVKNKKKGFNNNYVDEENLSLKEIIRESEHKKYKNYGNLLRTKDVSTIMQYEEE